MPTGQLGYDESGQIVTQATASGKIWALILGALQVGQGNGVLGVDETGGVVTQQTANGKIRSLILGAFQGGAT